MSKGCKAKNDADKTLDVYVKLPSGKTTTVHLSGRETIQTVCRHIAEEEGVPEETVVLKYTGKVLKKEHTLGFLGVCQETILKADVVKVQNVQIFVKKPTGETTQIGIQNIAKVSDLKAKIADECGIPSHKQKIKASSAGSAPLTNGKQTILEAGLKNESVLTLEEVADRPAEPAPATAAAEAAAPQLDEDEMNAILTSFDCAGRNVEIVFSFDTTGSMYDCLATVRTKLRETIDRLIRDIPNIRIGIIAHGDYCDYAKYVIKVKDLTDDVNDLVAFVADVPPTGGGDAPEAYEWVLHKSRSLDWSENSAKALVVIGDDVPHSWRYTDQYVNWHEELDMLVALGVKVYGVQASENQITADFYKELADRSGGAYISFKNFSIIQDMFYAVCYNESAPEQLEAFSEEVEGEGRMTEEVKAVFTQIQEATKEPQTQQASQRYRAAAWWDPALDKIEVPTYSYDAQTDLWKPNNGSGKKRGKSKKCTVM